MQPRGISLFPRHRRGDHAGPLGDHRAVRLDRRTTGRADPQQANACDTRAASHAVGALPREELWRNVGPTLGVLLAMREGESTPLVPVRTMPAQGSATFRPAPRVIPVEELP